MKCCICAEKEFSVILEYHLPVPDLPNLVCNYCMKTISIQCAGTRIGNFVKYAIENGMKHEKGKRCK